MEATWIGAVALAALGALYVVVGASTKRRRRPPPSTQELLVARAREIRNEGQAQRLPSEQVTALERELALDLLAASTAPAPSAAKPPTRRLLAFGAVAVAILALSLYAWWGDAEAPRLIAAFERLAEDRTTAVELTPALAARAARRPDDLNTWLHLAQLRMQLADYDAAADAYAAVHRLIGPDEHNDVAWARARFLADGGFVTPSVRQFAERVLATSPDHPAVLEMLAMGALRGGDFNAAAAHLAKLLTQDIPAERRRLLEETLALARSRLDPQRPHISVAVTVTGSPPPWLVVFARAPGGGPPLAVTRTRARATQTVVLDDANAVAATAPLSEASAVRMVARLSKTGTAEDYSAEAVSEPVDPAAPARVSLSLRASGGAERAAEDAWNGIAVELSLAVEMEDDVPIFVIARAPDRPGPPVAVRRLVAGDLPTRIVLGDADVMLPDQRLSALPEVEVLARASLGGDAGARPGDIESARARTRTRQEDQATVTLRLDRIVPDIDPN